MPSKSQPVPAWTPGTARGHSLGSANSSAGEATYNVAKSERSTFERIRRINDGNAMKKSFRKAT